VHGTTPAAGGNGSQARPWNSLSAVARPVAGYQVDGVNAPLLSTAPYYHFNPATKTNQTWTNGSGQPIEPGDEIVLMSGNYGDVFIGGLSLGISNSAFVTVAAAPGQTPALTSLFVGETNKWVFNGLKVQSLQPAALSGNALVQIKDGGATLPTSDFVLENLTISSTNNAGAWSQAQWRADARNGFSALSTAPGTNTKCVSCANCGPWVPHGVRSSCLTTRPPRESHSGFKCQVRSTRRSHSPQCRTVARRKPERRSAVSFAGVGGPGPKRIFKAASLWRAGLPLPHGRRNPKNSIDRFWTLLLT
jgi:hypothetical protein